MTQSGPAKHAGSRGVQSGRRPVAQDARKGRGAPRGSELHRVHGPLARLTGDGSNLTERRLRTRKNNDRHSLSIWASITIRPSPSNKEMWSSLPIADQQLCSGSVLCQSRQSRSPSTRQVPASNCTRSSPRSAVASPSTSSLILYGPVTAPSPYRSVLPSTSCLSASPSQPLVD